MATAADHGGWQRYQCVACGARRWIPEHPSIGPESITVACDGDCTGLTTHYAMGRSRHSQLAERGMFGQ